MPAASPPRAHATQAQGPSGRPLLITAHPGLLDDLLRLAAAAGVELDVAADARLARRSWTTAALVLVGADLVVPCIKAGLRRRRDVMLVGIDLDDADVWRRAVALGAERVVFLPDAEPYLVDELAETADPVRRRAIVVGVLGARGGAGATSLSVALGLAGRRRLLRTVLVDADPLGGGIDLALGAEEITGLRWPDFSSARGRLPAQQLADALPSVYDLPVLAWSRADVPGVPPDAMDALLASASRGTDLVVVDLPRALDETGAAALASTTMTLIVVPAEVRAAAAARRICANAAHYCGDLRVVARVPGPAGLSAATVAHALGLPLAGLLTPEPGLAEALERGEAPGARRKGPLAQFCAEFLDDIGLHDEAVAA